MAANDIQIKVGSQDNTAPDFDALKTRLAEIGKIVADATIGVEDKEGLHQLDLFKAKFEEAAKKTGSARLDLAGAARIQATLSGLILDVDKFGAARATAELKADTGDADAKLAATDGLLDRIGAKRVSAKVSLDDGDLVAQAAAADTAINGFGGALMGLPAIIGAVLAALPALPGVLAGVGAAAGTAGLAFMPVIKALQDSAAAASSSSKSMGQSSAQLAATESANATAIVAAQRAISDAKTQAAHDAITSDQAIAQAQQAVTSAQTQAAHDAITSAESVAQAEESLKNAEATEQQAQESLTQARQQAVLTLQQLNDTQKDSALGVQQAQLNLRQAELSQQQVDKSSTSTALQKAQAALSVKEAQQALVEAQQQATNSTKAANQANKDGINGSPGVIAAKRAQQQAIQGVADAQRALMDAQRQAAWTEQQDAQAIKNAQQGVAKAEQQAAWTQQKDAEAIKTAVQNLSNTYKQQGLAAQAASTVSGGATNKFAKDMASMTGAGRAVTNQILHLKDTLTGLEGIAQRTMLPGFSVFLTGAQKLLPLISGEVGTMGKMLGGAFAEAGRAMASSGVQKELKAVLGEGNQFMRILIPAIGGVAGAFLKLGSQSGPEVAGLAKGLAAILGGVTQLFKALAPGASAFGSIFKSLGVIIGLLGQPLGTLVTVMAQGLAPALVNITPLIKTLAAGLTDVLKAIPPSLLTLLIEGFLAVAAATKVWAVAMAILDVALAANPLILLTLAVAALAVGIVELVKHWDTVWADIKKVAKDAWDFIYNGWGKYLLPLLGPAGLIILAAIAVQKHWQTIWNAIKQVAQDFYNWIWNDFGAKIKNLFTQSIPGWFDTARHDIAAKFDGIRHDLATIWDQVFSATTSKITSSFKSIVGWFSDLPGRLVNALTGMGHSLANFAAAGLNEMWNAFKRVAKDIENWFSNFGKDIINVVKKIWGILSPSSVFAEMGDNLMLGLEKGIKRSANKAHDANKKAQQKVGNTGPGAPGGGDAANAALARKMYPQWATGQNWKMWNFIAMAESGWNSRAQNASGALGIAQALGHGVPGGGGTYGNQYGGEGLNLAGDRAANSGNAGSQITWMHNYILDRYKSLTNAYNYHLAHGVYAAGGATQPGWISVGEHGRELIKVPGGSTVYPHGASESMMNGAPVYDKPVQLVVSSEGQSEFEQFMVTAIRKWVRTKGGGNVQTAFGRT